MATLPGPGGTAQALTVALFNPEKASHPFWARTFDFAQAAADDLGVTLERYHAEGDLERMRAQVTEVVTRERPPDYILFKPAEAVGPFILDVAERHGVDALLLNAGLADDQRDVTKGPRVRYKRWLGQIMPDDLLGGYLLARNMFRHAELRDIAAPSGRIELIGLTSSAVDEAAIDRVAGLRLAERGYYRGDIVYLGIAQGSKAKAEQVIERGYESYPGTTLYWSDDDLMALGMMEALRQRTRRLPGVDAILGGFNWSPWALRAVQDNQISFLMGGHFMTAGAALVMLYDHANGADFAEVGREQGFGFGLLHGGNIEQLAPILSRRDWSWVDFKRFSRALNPDRGAYNFSASTFLRARKR